MNDNEKAAADKKLKDEQAMAEAKKKAEEKTSAM